jgi:Glutamyl- and glutaminyl-tRNA synthetases
MTIRTRIAPSPTVDPHVGTAYIALFNYAYAKSQGDRLVLRIEDTVPVRSTAEWSQLKRDALRWPGSEREEGPGYERDFGGSCTIVYGSDQFVGQRQVAPQHQRQICVFVRIKPVRGDG